MQYTYDAIGNLIEVSNILRDSSGNITNLGTAEVNYEYDIHNWLSEITTLGNEYYFYYDEFGNTTKIEAGSNTLAEYTYNANNGKLNTLTYGNGDAIKYEYDALDRIKNIWYNNNGTFELAFSYTYDSAGRLRTVKDCESGDITLYEYNDKGDFISLTLHNESSAEYEYNYSVKYDDHSRISSISSYLSYTAWSSETNQVTAADEVYTSYTYDAQGMLDHYGTIYSEFSFNSNLSYDTLGRLSGKYDMFSIYSIPGMVDTKFQIIISYEEDSTENTTSNRISEYETGVYPSNDNPSDLIGYKYTYDDVGNITEVCELSDDLLYQYYYDSLGQLVRENNVPLNKTYIWTYDSAGNRLSEKVYTFCEGSATPTSLLYSTTYEYSQDGFPRIIEYNNDPDDPFTYDENGNPINYHYYNTLTWEGRRLESWYSTGTIYYEYEYNDEGIRTKKTVEDGGIVVHEYILNGSQIVAEKWFENDVEHLMVFIYDENGSPIGMRYRNESYIEGEFDTYYFVKNIQGDITYIFDSEGTKLIHYKYDAWGDHTTVYYNDGASTSARYNPFRYRGYYYDSETTLYYLESRYYDPDTGRFLSPDKYVSTGTGLLGHNMYAYCNNNPVNWADPSGQLFISVFVVSGLALGCTLLFSGCSKKAEQKPEPYKSPEEAAKAFSEQIYSSSAYIRHEYSTEIYSRTIDGKTTYNYTSPKAGYPHSAFLDGEIPSGTQMVAYAHTHPNSNHFSSTDIQTAINLGVDAYVVGPNLELQRYNLSSSKTISLGVISPIPLTNDQRAALITEFQASWNSHVAGGCNFGCNSITWPTP